MVADAGVLSPRELPGLTRLRGAAGGGGGHVPMPGTLNFGHFGAVFGIPDDATRARVCGGSDSVRTPAYRPTLSMAIILAIIEVL